MEALIGELTAEEAGMLGEVAAQLVGHVLHELALAGAGLDVADVPVHVPVRPAIHAQRQVAALVHDAEVGRRRRLLIEGDGLHLRRLRRARGERAYSEVAAAAPSEYQGNRRSKIQER